MKIKLMVSNYENSRYLKYKLGGLYAYQSDFWNILKNIHLFSFII